MRLPRFSIEWLMFGVAVVAVEVGSAVTFERISAAPIAHVALLVLTANVAAAFVFSLFVVWEQHRQKRPR